MTLSIPVSVDQHSWLCVCDVRQPLLQGAAGGRVVCVRGHDRLLGEPSADADVPVPRHGEVPRHPMAHD